MDLYNFVWALVAVALTVLLIVIVLIGIEGLKTLIAVRKVVQRVELLTDIRGWLDLVRGCGRWCSRKRKDKKSPRPHNEPLD